MSNIQPRALVVAPTPTWPLDYGNRKRIYMVCKELQARGFEIHYVHYASEGDWRNNMPMRTRYEMDKQWDIVDHVYPSVGLHDWPKHGDDHLIDEWWDPALENHLKHIFNGRTYDVVVVNYTWLSKALEFVPAHCYKVLDTHDKFSGRRELLAKNGIDKEFFHTTESEEVIGLSRADLVWAIKDEERLEFEAMGVDAKIETLIHMDEPRTSNSPRVENGFTTFGFIGARNNINKVNIKNFIKIALPIFEQYLAPLEIHIAGSICKEFNDEENSFIKLLGYVDTVDRFYDGIDAAIVPMEFSTGLKIKAGEALSQSKALVSHIHAMEGYPTTHDLHRCESFEAMALAMCELAYENEGFEALEKATLDSCDICFSSIQKTVGNLADYVKENHDVIFLLPSLYGDEKSPIHWLCLAHMEWLSWRFNPIYVSLHNEYFGYNDSRVRYISEDELKTLITTKIKAVVYNLDEELPKYCLAAKPKVIDMVSQNRNKTLSFVDAIGRQTVPGFGHFKNPNYLNLCFDDSQGIVILSNKDNINTISALVNLIKITENENISFAEMKDFSALDIFVKSLIQNAGSMPRLVIIAKNLTDLTPSEQIFLDMMGAHGIKTSAIGMLTDMHALKFINEKQNDIKEVYNNYFYEKWFSIENILLKT
jgi:hypothetical protein